MKYHSKNALRETYVFLCDFWGYSSLGFHDEVADMVKCDACSVVEAGEGFADRPTLLVCRHAIPAISEGRASGGSIRRKDQARAPVG